MTPQQRSEIGCAVAQRHRLYTSTTGKDHADYTPEVGLGLSIIAAEELVTSLSKGQNQLFEAELINDAEERKLPSTRRGDALLRFLMIDQTSLSAMMSTHEVHPSAELLLSKIAERQLFNSLAFQSGMQTFHWLRWIDTLNGCVVAVRKQSASLNFKKLKINFEDEAKQRFLTLKRLFHEQLRAAKVAKHIHLDLIYTKSGVIGRTGVHCILPKLQTDLNALIEELKDTPAENFLSAAWAIDCNSDLIYRVHLSILFSARQPEEDCFHIVENVRSAWHKITKTGLVQHPEENGSMQHRFGGTGIYQWDSSPSKSALDSVAYYMSMPETYLRLRLEPETKSWGITLRDSHPS